MLQSTTLQFLQNIRRNNNREWFLVNKSDFELAKADVHCFATELIEGLSVIDPLIPADLDPKSCVMRLYRDIRFSKDKTPYKENFAIAISPNGKNFNGPGYYLHIHPENPFVAAGCWMPSADQLKAIRQEIDYNSADFHHCIEHSGFQKYFTSLDTSQMLKTVPRGYAAEHADSAFLKLKSFTANASIQAADLCAPTAAKNILAHWKEVYPLTVFLRNALS